MILPAQVINGSLVAVGTARVLMAGLARRMRVRCLFAFGVTSLCSRRRGISNSYLLCAPSLSASQQSFAGHFHLRTFGQLVTQAFEGQDVLGISEGFPRITNVLVGTFQGVQPSGLVSCDCFKWIAL